MGKTPEKPFKTAGPPAKIQNGKFVNLKYRCRFTKECMYVTKSA
jgi:hypothetical protein